MNTYEWILFDADETLFHFDAFTGLQRVFSIYDGHFSEDDYQAYQAINKSLWVEYQQGSISAQHLQQTRFHPWSHKIGMSPGELNNAFMAAMAEISVPLEGAISLLRALKGRVKLGIVTNGFIELQQNRLERTGLNDYFDVLVISEQVGVAKPHRDIFDHALSAMGKPDKERVLMVGDTLETDILGGRNAGLHTCWLNSANKPKSIEIEPTYQVSSLMELEQRFCKASLIACEERDD